MRVRRLSVREGDRFGIGNFPNFHKTGSVTGMKCFYYGRDVLLIKCGNYIYNISSVPSIYEIAV